MGKSVLAQLEAISRRFQWGKGVDLKIQKPLRLELERRGVKPPMSGLLSLYLYRQGYRSVDHVPDPNDVIREYVSHERQPR